MKQRDKIILEKIVSYCKRIADNLSRHDHSYEAFAQNHMFQDACCMCVVQIGELVGQPSEVIKQQNEAIPWRIIKDARNSYVHAYGAIDCESVWGNAE